MGQMLELPAWEMLPDIGLYMDQVITLMHRTFSGVLSDGEITKSMVNNYVKAGLVARPVAKKYDREQLATLMMICVLKQAMSMEHIGELLRMVCGSSVQEGYTAFARQVSELQRFLHESRRAAGQLGVKEQAIAESVTAAICTIGAGQLLQEMHGGEDAAGR